MPHETGINFLIGELNMARNSDSAQSQEVRDLNNRIEWLDDERRKLSRKLSDLEQGLELRDREISGREQRIQALEKQLSSASAQLSRLPQIDTQLSQFKDEMVQLMEQYEKRRIRAEGEADRLRKLEQEVTSREIAEIRKELPPISRLETAMELRIAEENRLSELIGGQKAKIASLVSIIEARESELSFLQEKESQNSRSIAAQQTSAIESNKRWEQIRDQVELMKSNILRLEGGQRTINEDQEKIRESLKHWMEQVQIGEYERNKRVEGWQRLMDERSEAMNRFAEQWVSFSDQYKEARMAVQTLAEWQKQLEQQQREASEALKFDANRLNSRWEEFKNENSGKLKNYSIELEQRWATVDRYQKQVNEKMMALDVAIAALHEEKEMLQRIQTAQTDAIKRIPLLWMEELDKAASQNPNRRRQPALVPVRED